MRKPNIIRYVRSAAVAAVFCGLGMSDAQAWSFGSWGSFGGWGSCGSYGSYGYTSYRRYSGYGSSGSYGSYGSYGNYGNYSRVGSSWSYDRDLYTDYSAPAEFAPEPPLPPAPETGAASQATIHLSVPADAQVFVNDEPTNSGGPERDYVSSGLEVDQTYVYRLRVEFEENGEPVVENKLVRVKAGDVIDLRFGHAEQLAVR